MEQSKQMADNVDKDEISLKELILKIQEWFTYLLSKWLIIFICGIVGAGLGFTYALMKKASYVGELTFVLEESNKASSLGAYAGLASQFGVDLGTVSGGGIFAGDNILEFLRSRLMVEKTLLTPINFAGKETSLADFYIDFNKLRESWGENPQLRNLHFPATFDRSKFTLQQDSILYVIYTAIIKTNLLVAKPDKKLSFISVKFTSSNEIFAKVFIERLVKEATTFYIDTKTKRSKFNVDKLQAKADSIEYLLNKKTYSAAAAQDFNLNAARRVATVGTEVILRDKVVLQTMYGEVIKNLEFSKMSMSQETPIIQIVDTPILPLKKEKLGKLKALILGGIIGGILIVFFLLIRRQYKQIMA